VLDLDPMPADLGTRVLGPARPSGVRGGNADNEGGKKSRQAEAEGRAGERWPAGVSVDGDNHPDSRAD
jgi:hypothetical protein